MNRKMLKKAALSVALGACLGALAPTVMAQSATGAELLIQPKTMTMQPRY